VRRAEHEEVVEQADGSTVGFKDKVAFIRLLLTSFLAIVFNARRSACKRSAFSRAERTSSKSLSIGGEDLVGMDCCIVLGMGRGEETLTGGGGDGEDFREGEVFGSGKGSFILLISTAWVLGVCDGMLFIDGGHS